MGDFGEVPGLAFFTDHGEHPTGVIHIGAHQGEEIPWYLLNNMAVVAFEPQPEPYAALVARFGSVVECVNLALGEAAGDRDLYIPKWSFMDSDNSQSASFRELIPRRAADIGWPITTCRVITVPCTRLDTWAVGRDMSRFDSIVMDIQGSELEVLRGCGELLSQIKFLVIECCEVPIYQGESSFQEISDFLAPLGFSPQSAVVNHGDVMFGR